MLAVLDRISTATAFEFAAVAPQGGPLADALRTRAIRHIPFELRDQAGHRLPRETASANLLAAIRECAPDLVHANSLSMGRLTGAVAAEIGIPTVAHLRDIIGLSKRAVADLNRNRLLIAVSRATQAFHIRQGLDASRTRVIYNGVDCELFRPRASTGWLRRELDLPDDAFLVATIGQIGLRKGQDVLAEAAIFVDRVFREQSRAVPARSGATRPGSIVKRPGSTATRPGSIATCSGSMAAINVHYLLVGERNSSKPESVRFEQDVVARFEHAGLGGHLHRLGYRDDVDRLMNEADLLVHPAHQEPLGRVLLEAAAAGLPIMATAVGGTAEILRDGESARLVPPGDPQALAEAIVEMAADPEKRAKFAAAARERAVETFNIDRAARELAAVWREVC